MYTNFILTFQGLWECGTAGVLNTIIIIIIKIMMMMMMMIVLFITCRTARAFNKKIIITKI